MVSIGLDLSLTATGVYVLNGSVFSTEIKTKPEGFGNSIQRCDFIANAILDILKKYKPDIVSIENYFVGRQPKTVIQLAELGSVVRVRLLDAGFSFLQVAPTVLKKFITGMGNCGKDVMMKEMFKKYKVDTNSNNVADAGALAYFGQAIYNIHNNVEQALFKYQIESVKLFRDKNIMINPYRTIHQN